MFKKVKLFVSVLLLVFAFISYGFGADNFQICKEKNYTPKQLYSDLKKAPVSSEDLGRYVGYGGREFKLYIPIFGSCLSFYNEGQKWCEYVYNSNRQNIIEALKDLKNNLDQNTKLYDILSKLDFNYNNLNDFQQKNKNVLVEYDNYINSIVFYIKKKDGSSFVYNIPYKFLVPFNVTFNWSIQNLSSYYTDIGFVWLLLWGLVVISFFYSIFIKNKILAGLSLSTIFGYIIWWFVGNSILWYGIGLIIWTMLTVAVFLKYLAKNISNQYLLVTFFSFFFIIFLLQYGLNFVRISSQGGAGPMTWYKQNNGWSDDFIYSNKTYNKLKELGFLNSDFRLQAWYQIKLIYDIVVNTDNYKEKIRSKQLAENIAKNIKFIISKKNQIKSLFVKFPYIWKDVFNLQFGHYNRFLPVANSRKENEGIFIGGTYMRYFINNQKNVYYDHMLVSLWEWFSDENLCKSYRRIRKDKKIKYIVIDPNIGTVVRFDNASNKTLFDRFFGDIDLGNWTLKEKGVMVYLFDMVRNDYSKLFYTNNIPIKYAFISSNEDIKNYILSMGYSGEISDNDILTFRYALLGSRYPWSANLVYKFTKTNSYNTNINYIAQFIYFQMQRRILDLNIIEDIIDIRGDAVDVDKIKEITKIVIESVKQKDIKKMIEAENLVDELLLKEKKALDFVLGILLSSPEAQSQSLKALIEFSYSSPSQIFIVEFKD